MSNKFRVEDLVERSSTIVDLVGFTPNPLNAEHTYEVESFYAGYATTSAGASGGGKFVWVAGAAKSLHDGIEYISPTVPWNGTSATLSAWQAKTGETSPAGTGCWRRSGFRVDDMRLSWFGANVALSDNTDQINKAIDKIRQSQQTAMANVASYKKPKIVFEHGGFYTCLGSINATGMIWTGWIIEGNGASIISKASGKAAFDLLGSARYTIRDLTLIGDAATPPAWGFGIGRNSSNSAGKWQLYNVITEGHFTRAAMYNFAAEVTGAYQCRITNTYNPVSGNSYCLIQDSENLEGYISDFTTQTLTSGVVASFNESLWSGCEFRHLGEGVPIRFSGSEQSRHRFFNCYARTDNNHLIETYNCSLIRQIDFDIHGEAATLQKYLVVDNVTSGGTVTLQNISIHDHYVFCTDSVVDTTGSTNTVVFDNFNLKVVDVVPTTKPFGATATQLKLLISGKIEWPNSRTLDLSNACFSGEIIGKNATPITHTLGAYKILSRPESESKRKNIFKGEVRSVSTSEGNSEGNFAELFGATGTGTVGVRVGSATETNVNAAIEPKGTGAVRAGNTTNLASGAYSGIVGGQQNNAVGSHSVVSGGFDSDANAQYSGVLAGNNNVVVSSSQGAVILGGSFGFIASRKNSWAMGCGANAGRHQSAGITLAGSVTNSAANIDLTSDLGSVSSGVNQFVLQNNSVAAFRGVVVARDTVTNDTKCFNVSFAAKKGATNSTLSVLGVVVDIIYADAATSGWALTIANDASAGAPRFRFSTGSAVVNEVRLTANITAAEVA